jgi:hypothetical protein
VTPPSRLLHVGPHKTGTTTVQSAFHYNREALRAHGVCYVGPNLQPTEAAKAISGLTPEGPGRDAGLARWRRFLDKAFASGARSVVLSSEFLCEAMDDEIAAILHDFADDDTRVVVTLRPLARILPSQWQQYVQVGMRQKFEAWVKVKLATFDEAPPSGFWRRHRDDHVVARWAKAIGPENVTVLVVDEEDIEQLPREFARLLGLPEGVLVPRTKRANRSLSWEEVEMIRQFNIAFTELNKTRVAKGKQTLDLSVEKRLTAWNRVKSRPGFAEDHKVELPALAVDRVAELSQRMLDGIRALGVEIVGPAEQLLAPAKVGAGATPESVNPQLAAEFAARLVEVTMLRPPKPAPTQQPKPRSFWSRLPGSH